MTTSQTHHSRRRHILGVALAVVAAVALTVGVATSAAATKRVRTQFVVTKSPAQPVKGQPFTITMQLLKGGVPEQINNPACLGMTNSRPIAVSTTNDGTTATCTWNIPSNAGPTFDGMAVAFDANGVEWYTGYDWSIG
jgi:hypothetical protein